MENEGEAWNFFEDVLPPEVAEIVFSFLSLEDIVYVSIVCKSWNSYFDTKDIWRKISEHYYGELSPKNVDLTQTLRWKRIFFALHNAHRWSTTFPATHTSYETLLQVPAIGTAELGPSGQYIHTRTFSLDVKMAGKIVHMKREPIIMHDRQWLFQPITTRVEESHYRLMASDGKGKFLFESYNTWNLYDSEESATTSPADHHVIQFGLRSDISNLNLHPTYSFTAGCASFNSRFVVLANTVRFYIKRSIDHVIFDLQSTCDHVRPFFKDSQKRKFFHRTGPVICKDFAVTTPFGALGVFASQLVPEKIVFMLREPDEARSIGQYVFHPKLAIWKHGEGLNERDALAFKHDIDVDVSKFSEHVIGEHHWLCFDMGRYTRIVDLNNFTNQFKLDLIPRRMWIPKKNKIILASNKKITVFDLQLNRWTSRMACPNEVRAMAFIKSERILFVADSQFVHAFHWETAKLISSFQHPLAQGQRPVETLYVAYDQVIILNGTICMKMPTKCDV